MIMEDQVEKVMTITINLKLDQMDHQMDPQTMIQMEVVEDQICPRVPTILMEEIQILILMVMVIMVTIIILIKMIPLVIW